AVRPGVATTDDDDVLAGGGDLVGDLAPGHDGVRLVQEVHGEVDAVELAPGDGQVARHGRARGDHDGVVPRAQVVPRDVDADLDAGAEASALGLHLGDATVDVVLLELEVGDAVAQEAADRVVPLVHGDRVAGARELLRGGEAGGPGPDDGDREAGEALRHLRRDVPAGERLVDDRDLDVLDRHGRLVDAEHAARLARRRAHATGELGEVVRLVQAVDRVGPLLAVDEVVPLGDEVPEGAALVAERDAAVHAAARLLLEERLPLLEVRVHVLPVPQAHGHRAVRRELTLPHLQESAGVSHG